MNKEVHYEGWLIKSPPTKRIWRARWRRRWFTLKQGEIPEQFCLEYYTDRNCRKLKGVIDLDQCEQVDCGLRLENRKQKFQFMFDIKTPKRTYYLAADTEADMRDWVNCICQVCHLLDTKQSSELLQDASRNNRNPSFLIPPHGNATNVLNKTPNATTTTPTSGIDSGSNCTNSSVLSTTSSSNQPSFNNSIQLRRQVVSEQPQIHSISSSNNNNNTSSNSHNNNMNNKNNNSNSSNINNSIVDCPYVNTEYSNRETLLCDMRFDSKQLAVATSPLCSPGSAIYLNSPMFGAKQPQREQEPHQQQQQQQEHQHHQQNDTAPRRAVNANGVVRKIPENLVLSSVSLSDLQQQQQQLSTSHSQSQTTPQQQQQHLQQHSVQPSPAPSTASGPYIPISECFSGSPKFAVDGNNPTTPLNNLDPKFYDTPRCHNNIGLNLTNDQSYSPKITNCNLQTMPSPAGNKNRSHRSDSDSESVFTDDEEWARPLPLRENVDRSTRPSDSSVENESFVLTYSQRFSKIPDKEQQQQQQQQQFKNVGSKASASTSITASAAPKDPIESMHKAFKNKNNLMLDFMEKEKTQTDPPQLSDTENTSPAIGPRDARSVVEESYDIPRSHNLPYHNMGQFFEKATSPPETNPIAASTPNLMAGSNAEAAAKAAHVRTLPRPHCYTNAAPTKIEGNVFRYDFIEQDDLPPVNRKLKPKINLEDKPPEEAPAKPPTALTSAAIYDNLASKLMASVSVQSPPIGLNASENKTFTPPSVDRKLKPNLYKTKGMPTSPATPTSRRSTGAPLSMVLTNDNNEGYVLETRTLPRQLRSNLSSENSSENAYFNSISAGAMQMNVSAAAAIGKHLQKSPMQMTMLQSPAKNEHKLQYFDLDVANPPQINRQSMSVGNLSLASGGINRVGGGLTAANPSSVALRTPPKSGVVYNFVDFVKTEAFKRIREERKKESEGNSSSSGNTASGNVSNSSSSTK